MQKAQDEPKTIVALKRKTFTRLISLWEKFLLTDKTIEDTWSSVTSTCVDNSTIYNAVGYEWLTVMNEEGDVVDDIDLEKLKPEEMVEITEGKVETEPEITDEDSLSEDLTEEKNELPSEEVEKEESAPEIESSEEE